MGGREDYEERRKKRIERYKRLSEKSKEKSDQYMNSNANRTLSRIPLGQPILTDHYSAKSHSRLIERANNNIRKSIEEDKKSKFYSDRAESAENSKVIYGDDPQAIQKLEDKLTRLENERRAIKSREHNAWELTNIGAIIRETKKRIERIKSLENLKFEEKSFNDGKIVHNKEINRIQFLFNSIPNEDIRKLLKSNGFHWSRKEQAWQREFNQNCIRATERIEKKIKELEKQEDKELE